MTSFIYFSFYFQFIVCRGLYKKCWVFCRKDADISHCARHYLAHTALQNAQQCDKRHERATKRATVRHCRYLASFVALSISRSFCCTVAILPTTVDSHLKRAYPKLSVTNCIETIYCGLLSINPRGFCHFEIYY